jgi:hypothetical protein
LHPAEGEDDAQPLTTTRLPPSRSWKEKRASMEAAEMTET